MSVSEVIAALNLPRSCYVDRRIPKTLLVEHGAPTTADKRNINSSIEELRWVATLKPTTIAVPAFHDEVRDYVEIVVIVVTLRSETTTERLVELIHRAIPYPVFLVVTRERALTLSLWHKRQSQREQGATVLDGDNVMVSLASAVSNDVSEAFLNALSLSNQPRTNLCELYQGWIDTLIALKVAAVTGRFMLATSADFAAARREALRDYILWDAEINRLRTAAAKERQVSRQVERNFELKRAEAARAAAIARL